MSAGLEISKVLTVWSGHVPQITMDRISIDGMGVPPCYPNHYGAFMFVGCDEPTDTDIAAIFELARANGCDWIKFDCDGPVVAGLKKYDW